MHGLIIVNSGTFGPSHSLSDDVVAANGSSRWSGRDFGMECSTLVFSKPLAYYSLHNPVSSSFVPFSFFCCQHMVVRISCTIIAPTPLVAANFVILGMIIKTLGDYYSRLSTKWCKFICYFSYKVTLLSTICGCDRYYYILFLRHYIPYCPSRWRWDCFNC
jgi:hypothetical protein